MSVKQLVERGYALLNSGTDPTNFEWLGEYIANKLTAIGVPAPTAQDAAATLQNDIVELIQKRAWAEWAAAECERLDERDQLIAIMNSRESSSCGEEHARTV